MISPPFSVRKLAAAHSVRTAGVSAMLVTHLPDVQYLCGFTGSNAVLLLFTGKREAVLFTDGRYTRQAKAEAAGTAVVIAQRSALHEACSLLQKSGVRSCGVDAAHTTVLALQHIRKAMPADKRNIFRPLPSLIATEREQKDADEIARMRRAAKLGCALYDHILGVIDYGMTEMEVAAELEHEARLRGASGMSFETIVASGERSALPHGHATTARLPRNGFITLDFGVMLAGYCSDMTRTLYMGKASAFERDAYEAVLAAQMAGVDIVAPGVTCEEVDEACRSVLRRAGLAKWFTHSTGHGVGLEIHEGPRLAAGNTQRLEPGMVITVEPGVYISRRGAKDFGIRIEDMVLVTAKGAEVLTAASPKAWTTI
ncbi:MAG TPA: aminopeptidase P family protein [Acidobacteriaceae bacterium]|nr:aminopeptidase P family protein [Acidobacteriaceae bacterium]